MFQKRILLCVFAFIASVSAVRADHLELEVGDHICLVGNELGERMQHHNFWETLLHQQFPDHKLAVRNLCFPGDEVGLRIRIKNFGDPHKHLTHSKASVVLFFFGFNESFGTKRLAIAVEQRHGLLNSGPLGAVEHRLFLIAKSHVSSP